MREYVAIMRAIFRGEDPPRARSSAPRFHFMGYGGAEPHLPIYIAGLSPGMLRLAGEIADGVMLWLCTPEYIRDVVVPEVARGTPAARAGKPEGFDIVAAVPSAVTSEPDDARGKHAPGEAKSPTSPLPFYRAMLERSEPETPARRARPTRRRSIRASWRAIGSADEARRVRAPLRREREPRSPCVGGIAGTDFDATLDALAGSLD